MQFTKNPLKKKNTEKNTNIFLKTISEWVKSNSTKALMFRKILEFF